MKRRLVALALGTIAFAACGGGPDAVPPIAEGPPPLQPAKKGNLILYVSNQSFDRSTVDIRVLIDGRPAVDDDFAVLNQHNWVEFRFSLDDGQHVIYVESLDGQAILEERFEVKGNRWAVVDYWCCSDPSEPKFTFMVSPEPLAFV
jgi:hypothetical protein